MMIKYTNDKLILTSNLHELELNNIVKFRVISVRTF